MQEHVPRKLGGGGNPLQLSILKLVYVCMVYYGNEQVDMYLDQDDFKKLNINQMPTKWQGCEWKHKNTDEL